MRTRPCLTGFTDCSKKLRPTEQIAARNLPVEYQTGRLRLTLSFKLIPSHLRALARGDSIANARQVLISRMLYV